MNYFSNICIVIKDLNEFEQEWFSKAATSEDRSGYQIIKHADGSIVSIEDIDGDLNLDRIGTLVQRFLRKYRPNEIVTAEYTYTADRHKEDSFGGGAIAVSAGKYKCIDTSDLLGDLASEVSITEDEITECQEETEDFEISVEVRKTYSITVTAHTYEEAVSIASSMDSADIANQGSLKNVDKEIIDWN